MVFNADVEIKHSSYGASFRGFSDNHDAVIVFIVLQKSELNVVLEAPIRKPPGLTALRDKMARRKTFTDAQCADSHAEKELRDVAQLAGPQSESAQSTSHQLAFQHLDRSSSCASSSNPGMQELGSESIVCVAVQHAGEASIKIDQFEDVQSATFADQNIREAGPQ